MRTWMVVAEFALAGCVSKGPDVVAGSGVTVDPKTETVSIDPGKVPVLPDCGPGQVVLKGSGTSWSCASAAPDSLSLGGVAAASFAQKTDTVANATSLGGVDAASYALKTDTVANANTLAGHPPGDFLAVNGQAADSAKLGGAAPAAYVKHALDADIAMGGFRDTLTNSFCVGSPIIIIAPVNTPNVPIACIRGQTLETATTSTAGVFCGATAATTGNITGVNEPGTTVAATGYRAAKLLCEQAGNCGVRAHLCQPSEVVRSRELGISLPTGNNWYALGAMSTFNGAAANANDCNGFTSTAVNGAVMSGNVPTIDACSKSWPILCCE